MLPSHFHYLFCRCCQEHFTTFKTFKFYFICTYLLIKTWAPFYVSPSIDGTDAFIRQLCTLIGRCVPLISLLPLFLHFASYRPANRQRKRKLWPVKGEIVRVMLCLMPWRHCLSVSLLIWLLTCFILLECSFSDRRILNCVRMSRFYF